MSRWDALVTTPPSSSSFKNRTTATATTTTTTTTRNKNTNINYRRRQQKNQYHDNSSEEQLQWRRISSSSSSAQPENQGSSSTFSRTNSIEHDISSKLYNLNKKIRELLLVVGKHHESTTTTTIASSSSLEQQRPSPSRSFNKNDLHQHEENNLPSIKELIITLIDELSILFPTIKNKTDGIVSSINPKNISDSISLLFQYIISLKEEDDYDDSSITIQKIFQILNQVFQYYNNINNNNQKAILKLKDEHIKIMFLGSFHTLLHYYNSKKNETQQYLDYKIYIFQVVLSFVKISIRYYSDKIKSEEIIHLFMNQIFLPILETQEEYQSSLSKMQIIILDIIIILLRNKYHASAILSPLILNIVDDSTTTPTKTTGVEQLQQTLDNPLKKRITRILVEKFLSIDDDDLLLCIVCSTFGSVLDTLRIISNSNSSTSTKKNNNKLLFIDLDVMSIAVRIHVLLQPRSLYINKNQEEKFRTILKLLQIMISCIPQEMANHWNLFLSEEEVLSEINKEEIVSKPLLPFSQRGIPPLSILILLKEFPDIQLEALECIKVLLQVMPLKLWVFIPPSELQKQSLLHKKKLSYSFQTRHLRTRVTDALISLSYCVVHIFNDTNTTTSTTTINEIVPSFLTLTQTLFQQLPTSFDSILANALENIISSIALLIQNGLEGSYFLDACSTFISSLGGNVTPQGTISPILPPTKQWLSSNTESCQSFLKWIFYKATWYKNKIERLQCIIIIQHLIQMTPQICFRTEFELITVLRKGMNSHDRKICCSTVQIMERYLIGRQQYNQSTLDNNTYDTNIFAQEMYPMIYEKLQNSNDSSIISSCLSTFGYITGIEWNDIIAAKEEDIQDITIMLLEYSILKGGSTVKSTACKSIGDFCTEIISSKNNSKNWIFLDDAVIDIVNKVMYAMRIALNDDIPTVRSMALFAIGNLAMILKERNSILSKLVVNNKSSMIVSLLQDCYSLLNDKKNDKVIGNAIRTVGHLSTIAESYYYYNNSTITKEKEGHNNVIIQWYINVISNLTTKLQESLQHNKEGYYNTNWKQRISKKKYLRGSCTSFSLLYPTTSKLLLSSEQLYVLIEKSLYPLIQCLNGADNIQEKAVLECMKALNSLDVQVWKLFSSKRSDALGICFISCLDILYKDEENKMNISLAIQKEINSFLLYNIVPILSMQDYSYAMDHYYNSNNTNPTLLLLEFYYSWIIKQEDDNDTSSLDVMYVLETMLLYLQKQQHQDIDVDVVQKFYCLVLKERKLRRCLVEKERIVEDEDEL